ncbi:MAG TPA: hypothetical protein DDY70_03010 [Clostridiales bacterium]|nr:hypothetical protein [Clostridiales bacterium]
MNMFEEARAVYGMLRICGGTQEEAAKKLGVSQSYIANKLRLLKFSQPIQDLITDNLLTERHARALLRLPDEGLVRAAVGRIADEHLNVADTEALVDSLVDGAEARGVTEKIGVFSKALNTALAALRGAGIPASKTVEEGESGITITLKLATV